MGPKGEGGRGVPKGDKAGTNPENWCKLAPIWKLLPTSEKRNRQVVGSPEASELRSAKMWGKFFTKYWKLHIFMEMIAEGIL